MATSCTCAALARNQPAVFPTATDRMLCGVATHMLQEPGDADFTDGDLSDTEVDLAGDQNLWQHSASQALAA